MTSSDPMAFVTAVGDLTDVLLALPQRDREVGLAAVERIIDIVEADSVQLADTRRKLCSARERLIKAQERVVELLGGQEAHLRLCRAAGVTGEG